MTDSEALTEARVREVLADAQSNTDLTMECTNELVAGLCTLALSALGTAPAVGVKTDFMSLAAHLAKTNGGRQTIERESDGVVFVMRNVAIEAMQSLVASPIPASAAEIRAVTDEMVKRAEEAVYPRHERGFLMKPLIDPIDMRKALEAALSEATGNGK